MQTIQRQCPACQSCSCGALAVHECMIENQKLLGFDHRMFRPILKLIKQLRASEIKILLAVLIVLGGTWAFIELADEVKDRDTQRFDDWAIRALRRPDNPAVLIGPEWV